MLILLWLVPPAAVTVVAALWVGWIGRAAERQLDRDRAVRRMAQALEDGHPATAPRYLAPQRPRERSTGVARRR